LNLGARMVVKVDSWSDQFATARWVDAMRIS